MSLAATPNSAEASDIAFALASDGALGVGVGVGGRGVAVAVGWGAVVAVGAGVVAVGARVGTAVGAAVGAGTDVAVGSTGVAVAGAGAVVGGCVGTAVGSSSPPPQATAKIISAEGIKTIECPDSRRFIDAVSNSFQSFSGRADRNGSILALLA